VRLGAAEPGDLFAGREGRLAVAVDAAPWVPVSAARVLVNGAVAAERPVAAGDRFEVPLRFAGDSFVVVEVEGAAGGVYRALHPGLAPFAFTNPVFVDGDGDGRFTAPGLPAEPPWAIRAAREGEP
jgi:hypothetical protein